MRRPCYPTRFSLWRAIPLLVILLVLIHLPILFARLAAPPDRPVNSAGGSHSILFSATPTGFYDIFKMDADGSHRVRLTHSLLGAANPIWTPDGNQILYILITLDAKNPIYMMDADGAHQVYLTHSLENSGGVTWVSHDGQNSLFIGSYSGSYSGGDYGPGVITLMVNPVETPLKNYTDALSEIGSSFAWSQQIGPNLSIEVMDTNTFIVQHLADVPQSSYTQWIGASPDRQRLAVVDYSGEESKKLFLYVMQMDGSNAVQLSEVSLSVGYPMWSPNGQQLLFTMVDKTTDSPEIWTVRRDGNDLTQLTQTPETEASPAWSPDGQKIAFNRWVGGYWQIFTMNADGSNVTQLTNTPYDSVEPKWQP